MKVQRSSNIELFRIITMFFIIACHYVNNSGLMDADGIIQSNLTNSNSLFLLIFGAWGQVGINCFVLITGYYMCKNSFSIHKYLKLIGEIMFYKSVIYFIFIITGYSNFNIKELVKLIFPFYNLNKNFTGCFIIFYLMIPFLNIIVKNMNEKTHRTLLLLLLFIYTGIGTISNGVTYNYVTWFCVLYIIASYIRIYPNKIFEGSKKWGAICVAMITISCLSIISIAYIASRLGRYITPHYFVTDCHKILAVIVAVSLFIFFRNLNIRYNKFINIVASTTFGIFLIHTHSDDMRRLLWKEIFNCVENFDRSLMPLYAIGCVAIVFIVTGIIDIIRLYIVEPKYMKIINKIPEISNCKNKN